MYVTSRRWFIRGIVCALLFSGTPCFLLANDSCCHVNQRLIARLLAPSEPYKLKGAYKELPYNDVVINMVYFSRLRQMAPSEEADLGLLANMPDNEVDFWYLYSVTSPTNVQAMPEVNTFFQSYYETLSRLVLKHPKFLPQFIRLIYFADGEMADQLVALLDQIRKAIPRAYEKAVSSLPSDVRKRVE